MVVGIIVKSLMYVRGWKYTLLGDDSHEIMNLCYIWTSQGLTCLQSNKEKTQLGIFHTDWGQIL
jgi:hypothetical protein